jgi:hypothetical protein
MTDTANIDFLYNENTTQPPDPTYDDTNEVWNDNWQTEATSLAVWMAKRDVINGEAQAWEIFKIKGEQGPTGPTGQAIKLEAEGFVFSVDDEGNNPNPATIEITANLQNFDTPLPQVNWTLDPAIPYNVVSDGVITVAHSDLGANTRVKVTGSVTGDNGTLTDTVALHEVTDGSNAYTVYLTNDNHIFPSDESGDVLSTDLPKGSFQVRLYKGSTLYTYDASGSPAPNTYQTSIVTDGITVNQSTTTDTQRKFDPSDITNNSGFIDVTITDNNTGEKFVKRYSFTTSSAAVDGISIFKSIVFARSIIEPPALNTNPATGSYTSPVPTETWLDSDGVTVGWSDGIPSGTKQLWSTTRIFTNDGTGLHQDAWGPIESMTDTANIEFLYNDLNDDTPPPAPTSDGAGGWNDGWYSTATTSSVWMAMRKIENGVEGDWDIFKIKGEKGDTGIGVFKSIVFKRENGKPDKPDSTEGSYAFPVPTGWSDGVPGGTLQLWSTSRIFAEDGGSLEDAEWSEPVPMTNTEKVEYLYSTVIDNPSTPPNEADPDWTSDPSVNAVWMAIQRTIDGVEQGWNIYKIKGEAALNGFKSIVFIRSEATPATPGTQAWIDAGGTFEGDYDNPVPTFWSDGVPNGTKQLWSSTRVFNENGPVGSWTAPSSLTDTATIDFAYNDSTGQPTLPTNENPPYDNGWYVNGKTSSIWMIKRDVKNGVVGDWELFKIKGEKGDTVVGPAGEEYFKSTAFTRTAEDLSGTTPTGGNWANPIPNNDTPVAGVVWSDGIPPEDGNPLWSVTKSFRKDGSWDDASSYPWSDPIVMANNEFMEFLYNEDDTKPAETTLEDPYDVNVWSPTPTADAIWMAFRESKNGVFGS